MSFLLALKGEHKEGHIKSPRAILLQHSAAKPPSNNDSNELKNYIRTYRKEIQLPINYQTSIFLSKTPQRCMSHNSVLTLFCTNEKKPLCANCIYQLSAHKNHEIIPINKANQALKQELSSMLDKIENITLPKLTELINKNKKNLEQVDSQIGTLISSTTKHYNSLSSFIIDKKNEQIKYYQQINSKHRSQYNSLDNQLSKAFQFFTERLKQVSERTSEEHLLYNHNLVSHLFKMNKLLSSPLGEYHALQIEKVQNQLTQMNKKVQQLMKFDYKICPESFPSTQKRQSLQKSASKTAIWKGKKNDLTIQISHKNFKNMLKIPQNASKQFLKMPYTPRQQPKPIISPRMNSKRDSNFTPKRISLDKYRKPDIIRTDLSPAKPEDNKSHLKNFSTKEE